MDSRADKNVINTNMWRQYGEWGTAGFAESERSLIFLMRTRVGTWPKNFYGVVIAHRARRDEPDKKIVRRDASTFYGLRSSQPSF